MYYGNGVGNAFWLSPVTSPNQLNGADLLPTWVQNSGSQRSMSLNILKEWLQQNFAAPDFATQFAVPTTGFNIAATYNGSSIWLLLQPASGLATGTITLPLASATADGTELMVTTTQQIAAVTWSANGATGVFGTPTSLGANDAFRMRFYQPTNSWYKVT